MIVQARRGRLLRSPGEASKACEGFPNDLDVKPSRWSLVRFDHPAQPCNRSVVAQAPAVISQRYLRSIRIEDGLEVVRELPAMASGFPKGGLRPGKESHERHWLAAAVSEGASVLSAAHT